VCGDSESAAAPAPNAGPAGVAPAEPAAGSARPAPDAPIRHRAPRSDPDSERHLGLAGLGEQSTAKRAICLGVMVGCTRNIRLVSPRSRATGRGSAGARPASLKHVSRSISLQLPERAGCAAASDSRAGARDRTRPRGNCHGLGRSTWRPRARSGRWSPCRPCRRRIALS
jgi:hypothetical protein